MRGQQDLADIVKIIDEPGSILGFAQRRQEQGGQNRDNRDDDQEFDEREGSIPTIVRGPGPIMRALSRRALRRGSGALLTPREDS